MRETRNLLNLHLLFFLGIAGKSWTAFCRDRIAPTCTIRHPVWPIVALQRRMRFSARLAGFCRGRWHQRRLEGLKLTSFSVFVSNLDFRVPRSRQRGERAADRAVQHRKRGRPRGPESRPGLPRRIGSSTFWSRCGPGLLKCPSWPRTWIQVLGQGAWHPVAGRCFPCACGDPESPTSPPTRLRSGAHHGATTIETARRASLKFVCVFGHDVLR